MEKPVCLFLANHVSAYLAMGSLCVGVYLNLEWVFQRKYFERCWPSTEALRFGFSSEEKEPGEQIYCAVETGPQDVQLLEEQAAS